MVLAILLQVASPGPAPSFDLAKVAGSPSDRPPAEACGTRAADGEVVVCGGRRDQYRLPLPVERGDGAASGPIRGTGIAALTPPTPCGIFAGERRCGKAEAARYGYGGGRDPITLAARLAKAAVDGDAN